MNLDRFFKERKNPLQSVKEKKSSRILRKCSLQSEWETILLRLHQIVMGLVNSAQLC